jgi:hypothetical protein
MKTRRLTEQVTISILSGTTGSGGEYIEMYSDLYTLPASILNDQGNGVNQVASSPFNNGVGYSDSVRFFMDYLPLSWDIKVKRQYRVSWNENQYYIIGIYHLPTRKASIIQAQAKI